MRRLTALAITILSVVSTLVAAGGAQAVVVNDQGITAGVALVPGARSIALPPGVSAVTSAGPCTDPWLSSDFGGPQLPSAGLCYRGGAVMHQNEMFALTWDPHRSYWASTRGYVEQFLRDVADGSGTLTSPYALTQQYSDGAGRAQNTSVYGGGCIDYGVGGGSTCEFGNPTGAGFDYPANGCTPNGNSFTSVSAIGDNTVCLTDAQLQGEVSAMAGQTQIAGRTKSGHTPLVTLLLPPGVETCLDAAGALCSANGFLTPPPGGVSTSTTGGTIAAGTYHVVVTYTTATGESAQSSPQSITTAGATSTITVSSPPPASGVTGWYAYVSDANGLTYARQQITAASIGADLTLSSLATTGAAPPAAQASFCSYHSQVNVGGTEIAYVVQPLTAGTSCDEPDAPPLSPNPTPQQLSLYIGIRLVSPVSQSQIATIVNPGLNGWFALDGAEIDDNGGCVPMAHGLDAAVLGTGSQNPYLLQHEFNNAGVLDSDPFTYFGCAPGVTLTPAFVVPSAVDPGDVVQFDGSATASTLLVPRASYAWSFGDGTTAVGPSVEHAYGKGGAYAVKLIVTDRGGNVASLGQTIDVLGANGKVPPPPGNKSHGSLNVRLQLLPQGLRQVLSSGLEIRVSSNARADGFVTLAISRRAARQAHIRAGRGAAVVIGRGTVSGIRSGTVNLRVRLSRAMATKLGHLKHVALTVRMALASAGGARVAIDAAGRY
jgi:hypothetical protein